MILGRYSILPSKLRWTPSDACYGVAAACCALTSDSQVNLNVATSQHAHACAFKSASSFLQPDQPGHWVLQSVQLGCRQAAPSGSFSISRRTCRWARLVAAILCETLVALQLAPAKETMIGGP
jgi:hypothetical protein